MTGVQRALVKLRTTAQIHLEVINARCVEAQAILDQLHAERDTALENLQAWNELEETINRREENQ